MGSVQKYQSKRGNGKDFWYIYVIDVGTPGNRDQLIVRKDPVTGLRWADKKLCRQAMEEREALVRSGGYVQPTKETLSAYVARWLTHQEARLTPATIITYRNAWERLERHIGHLPLAKVKALHIQDAVRLMQDEGCSTSYVKLAHVVVGAALKQAVRWQLLARNPATGLILPARKTKPVPVWTKGEAAQFIRATPDQPEHALWLLLLHTGMRIGEALGLLWTDLSIDAPSRELHRVVIARTITRAKDYQWVLGDTTKTPRGRRTVGIWDERVMLALRAYRTRQKVRKVAAGPAWFDAGVVFDRGEGRIASPRFMGDRLTYACQVAKVPRLTPHALRHTAATLAIEEGVPAKLLADRLGHGGVELVNTLYAHRTEHGDQVVGEALARALGG